MSMQVPQESIQVKRADFKRLGAAIDGSTSVLDRAFPSDIPWLHGRVGNQVPRHFGRRKGEALVGQDTKWPIGY